MKKRKGIWILIVIALILITASGLLIRSFTTSNYSKLNLKTAVMLNLNRYLNPNSVKGKSINEIRMLSDSNAAKLTSNNPIHFSNILMII
jgi:acetyl esterase